MLIMSPIERRNRRDMLDSKYVDHHFEILSQNRNYTELVIYMRLFTKAEVLLKKKEDSKKSGWWYE